MQSTVERYGLLSSLIEDLSDGGLSFLALQWSYVM